MKRALITGITGQDGSYLAESLLAKGYSVYGMRRRSSVFNTERIDHIINKDNDFHLVYGDMTDSLSITKIIDNVKPDEIYNLAAQSHVGVSFETPEYTANVDGLGTLRVLEAVRMLKLIDKTKIYQASTSELYGAALQHPQNENTPFNPVSPYGVAKLYAFWITKSYRDAYGMYACNGILFNHESPRRGLTFVSRKITSALTKIKHGKLDCLYLGNLNSLRDWGHAEDYVEMQHLMLQQDTPKDYVIATGNQISVREFVNLTSNELSMDIKWKGEGKQEVALYNGKEIIRVDPKYYRPNEVESLLGDASLAFKELKWKPKHDIKSLISQMVNTDLKFI